MLLLSVLVTCVAVCNAVDTKPSLLKELEQKERELEHLKETSYDVNVERSEIGIAHLEYDLRNDEECRWAYRCGSANYTPGCGCWTYVKQQVGGLTIFNFNKFHRVGVETVAVEEDDALLKSCDDEDLSWLEFNYILSSGFTFLHCAVDGKLKCFCHEKYDIGSIKFVKINLNHCHIGKLDTGSQFWKSIFNEILHNGTHEMYSYQTVFNHKSADSERNQEEKGISRNLQEVCNCPIIFRHFDVSSGVIGLYHSDFGGKVLCHCDARCPKPVSSLATKKRCGSDKEWVYNTCIRIVSGS